MNNHSIEEIKAKVDELFLRAADQKPETEVVAYPDGSLEISVSAMYEAPGRDLKTVIALGEYLGTMNINEGGSIQHRGCDTCDYGSQYGFTLIVNPEK